MKKVSVVVKKSVPKVTPKVVVPEVTPLDRWLDGFQAGFSQGYTLAIERGLPAIERSALNHAGETALAHLNGGKR